MDYLAFVLVVIGVALLWLLGRPKMCCPKCDGIMRVYKHDPETRYTNKTTYECTECGHTEYVVGSRH